MPRDPEWAYLVTGYSECIDSFFAFGLFELARRSGFFPPELVETFEPVIQEECRHILLFANWWRGSARSCRGGGASSSSARRGGLDLHRLGTLVLARSMKTNGMGTGQDSNFTVTTAQAVTPVEIGVRDLMALCLEENDRRFAEYDARLVRPDETIPALARVCPLPRSALAEGSGVDRDAVRMNAALQAGDCVLVTGATGFLGSAVARALDRARREGARARPSDQPARQSRAASDCEVVAGDLTDRAFARRRDARRPLPVPCRGRLPPLGARSVGHPARQRRGHAQADAGGAGRRRRAHRLHQQRRHPQARGRHGAGRRDRAAVAETRPSAPTSAARSWPSGWSRT